MSLNSCGVSKEIARHGRDSRHLLLAIAHPSPFRQTATPARRGGDTPSCCLFLTPQGKDYRHSCQNRSRKTPRQSKQKSAHGSKAGNLTQSSPPP